VRLVSLNGEKLTKFSLGNEELAMKAKAAVQAANLSIEKVEAKPVTRNPQAPFTTSTMQQEASRKLGFAIAAPLSRRITAMITCLGNTVFTNPKPKMRKRPMKPSALQALRALPTV